MWQETEAESWAGVVENNDENVWLSLEKLVSAEDSLFWKVGRGVSCLYTALMGACS